MTDREAELRAVVARLRETDAVVDAFLAKSFTDRQVVVDVAAGSDLPDAVRDRLATHDVRPADAVYDAPRPTFASDVGDATRHHFVDVRTRGDHCSYVVDEGSRIPSPECLSATQPWVR
ncbi:hypothetical protein ACKVMT_17565 [Halobacteriales archaeon Cl-PHB]